MNSLLKTEVLAACNSLGYVDDQKTYFKEADCLESLKDLIKFLKRDDSSHEIRRQLGEIKVVQTDLLHMIKTFGQDKELFDVLIRLLVNLTTPALIVYEEQIPDEKISRKCYLEIIGQLQAYKEAFCDENVWVVLSEKLRDLLKMEWEQRLEEDKLVLERILILVRNVLHVPSNPVEEKRTDDDATVHDRILWCIHKSGMEDLILFMSNSDDFREFSLHTLEIVTLMLREQNAEQLSSAGLCRSQTEKQKDSKELLEIRQKESNARQASVSKYRSSRHSRFGGTYLIKDMKSISDRELIVHRALTDLQSLSFDKNKSRQKKRSNQIPMMDSDSTRRSTLSIRLFLKEFCIEFLNNAYNSIMNVVKDQLARKHTEDHDETYYLWAIRFFMEFNRLHKFSVELVSETMSVPTFHYIQTQLENYQDMIKTDKKKMILWSKRMHLALKAYHELLMTVTTMDSSKDESVRNSTKVIKTNLFYMIEYRELPYALLQSYDEVKMSRSYLKDLVEMTHIFLKLIDKHCNNNIHVIIQRKARKKSKKTKKSKAVKSAGGLSVENLSEEQLENLWSEISSDLSNALQGEIELPDNVSPFDAASEVPIDDQKVDAMRRIQGFLRAKKAPTALALLRAAREVWPENDSFGAEGIEPDDEFLALREVFHASLPGGAIFSEDVTNSNMTANVENEPEVGVDQTEMESEEDEEVREVNEESERRAEQEFDLKAFVARFANSKVVKAYTFLFHNYEKNSFFTNHCIVKMFHRLAWDCKTPAILFQASLFRDFQKILNNPHLCKSASMKEVTKFITFLLKKFFEVARKNNKVFVELLFWKGLRDAHEIEEGYGSYKEQSKKGAKLVWTEELEDELKHLYNEYKDRNDEDKDVVDLIIEQFSDSSKTERQIINHLKQMNLIKNTRDVQRKKNKSIGNRIPREFSEDEVNELRELHNTFKEADDVLGRILDNLTVKRPKRRVVQKLLELEIVSDRKQLRKKSKAKRASNVSLVKKNKKISLTNGHERNEEEGYEEATTFEAEQIDGDSSEDDSNSDNENDDVDEDDSDEDDDEEENLMTIKTRITEKKKNNTSVSSNEDILKIIKIAVETDGLRDAIVWVRDDLVDITKDKLEDSNTGAIPFVPILDENRKAMENPIFLKVIKALGLQPPSNEQETFWRYPESLSASKCQQNLELLERVLSGEFVEIENNIVDETEIDEQPVQAHQMQIDETGNSEGENDVPLSKQSVHEFNAENEETKQIKEDNLNSDDEMEVGARKRKFHALVVDSDDDELDGESRVSKKKNLIIESDGE